MINASLVNPEITTAGTAEGLAITSGFNSIMSNATSGSITVTKRYLRDAPNHNTQFYDDLTNTVLAWVATQNLCNWLMSVQNPGSVDDYTEIEFMVTW